jgi:hypothetical protein
MRDAGLRDVSYRLVGGGTVAIHSGTKPEPGLASKSAPDGTS